MSTIMHDNTIDIEGFAVRQDGKTRESRTN